MIILPVLNEETGKYDILMRKMMHDPEPLPRGMRAAAANIEAANNSAYAIAEQLGSMGFPVSVEELVAPK